LKLLEVMGHALKLEVITIAITTTTTAKITHYINSDRITNAQKLMVPP